MEKGAIVEAIVEGHASRMGSFLRFRVNFFGTTIQEEVGGRVAGGAIRLEKY